MMPNGAFEVHTNLRLSGPKNTIGQAQDVLASLLSKSGKQI